MVSTIVEIVVCVIIFTLMSHIAYKIDEEKGRKIDWFGLGCFVAGMTLGMIPWDKLFG